MVIKGFEYSDHLRHTIQHDEDMEDLVRRAVNVELARPDRLGESRLGGNMVLISSWLFGGQKMLSVAWIVPWLLTAYTKAPRRRNPASTR